MPTFHYLAKRGPKDTVEGELEVASRSDVLAHLGQLGYIPVQITEAAQQKPLTKTVVIREGKVPTRLLNQFTRQFASLIRSQVPLMRGLGMLEGQAHHPRLRRILGMIREDIRQGMTLSEALAKHPQIFSPLYLSLIRAGEAAGILDTVFNRLAVQADREEALRSKVRAAFTYPIFVGLVGLFTVAFLLTFVMPRIVRLFSGFGGNLPLPTQALLAVTALCQQVWFWGFLCLLAVAGIVLVKTQGARLQGLWDALSLRLPIVGPVIRELDLERFARSLGLLLEHGVPVLRAAEVAIPTVKNQILRRGLARLSGHLKEGHSLAESLKQTNLASPLLINTVAVGEEGGNVGNGLIEMANMYEGEIERTLETMAALLEPAMILFVGGIVGFIVLAVLLPIFDMSVIAR